MTNHPIQHRYNRLPRMEILERVSLYGNVVCLYCAMYFVIPTSTIGVEVGLMGDL